MLGQAAARAPAPIEEGAGPEPSLVVAHATLGLRGHRSGLAAQLAQAGGDRGVVVRDPRPLAVLFHGVLPARRYADERRGDPAVTGPRDGPAHWRLPEPSPGFPSYFRSTLKETLALTRKFLTLSFSTVAWNSLM